MRRTLTVLLTLTALWLAALTVACDADDDHGDRNDTTSATSPAATATRDPGPPCTNDATREAQRGREDFHIPDDEAHCRLRPGLLALEDLPPGWAPSIVVRPSRWAREAALSECGVEFPDLIAGFDIGYDRETSSERMTFFQGLYALEDGAGERTMAALHRSCALRSQDVGNTLNVQLTHAPNAGDDSIALTAQFDDIKVFITVIRLRDIIAVLSTTDPQLGDSARLVATLVRRIEGIRPIEQEAFTNEGCPPPSDSTDERTEALAGSLLTLEDFPAGWVEDPPEPCGLLGAVSDCDTERTEEPKAYAEAQFAAGKGDFLFESVRLYSSRDADDAFEATIAATSQPSECTITAGEASIRRTTLPVGGNPFGINVVVWRVIGWSLPEQESVVFLACSFQVDDVIVFLVTAPFAEQFGAFRGTAIEPGAPLEQFVIDNLTPIIEAARCKAEAIQPQLD